MLGSVIRGDFQVTSISKSNIVDVFFFDDVDVWHKCKITYIVADADSGKEKKVNPAIPDNLKPLSEVENESENVEETQS